MKRKQTTRELKGGISRKLYESIHLWMKYHYGSASKCENPNCPKISKNYEWAKIKEKEYDYKRENFMQLCSSCHQKYDFTEEIRKKQQQASWHAKKTHCHLGHPFDKENTYISVNYPRTRKCLKCAHIRYLRRKARLATAKEKGFIN